VGFVGRTKLTNQKPREQNLQNVGNIFANHLFISFNICCFEGEIH
jgi:hypothetical protein